MQELGRILLLQILTFTISILLEQIPVLTKIKILFLQVARSMHFVFGILPFAQECAYVARGQESVATTGKYIS